ncbi:MAG: thiazole synthase [Polyangiales bacterium]
MSGAQTNPNDDILTLGELKLRSRLFAGTGKYKDLDQARAALKASGTEMVTVALRRVDLQDRSAGSLLGMLQAEGFTLLPNTAGCYTRADALRTARLGRELLGTPWVKLEVIGDAETLFPDVAETIAAAKELVAEGFSVLPYVSDDPVATKALEDCGCVAVMPLAAPIGSGLGVCNPYTLEIIVRQAKVPVVVDAGVGTASDAARAMELGCDAVLMNTAIAAADDPVRMAGAMRGAVAAGRDAFLAGRMPRRLYANASSPLTGIIGAQHSV